MTLRGKADLHMHTRHSDGAPTVQALLDYVAGKTCLDVIAITDHDTIAGALEARALMARRPYPFELIVGEEVSTCDGHLVGLFLNERIPAGMSARDTVAAIHRQGGLAFAPHPFFHAMQESGSAATMVGLGETVRELALDAIETLNATPFLAAANRRARAFNMETTRLPELGASDGHILAAIGKGYTEFPGSTASDLAAALHAGTVAAIGVRYAPRELLASLNFWVRQQRRPDAMLRSVRPLFEREGHARKSRRASAPDIA
jgi:predicted metal-dependent phosphoesterase TrpH